MVGAVNNNSPYANPYIDKEKIGHNHPANAVGKEDDVSKAEQSKPSAVNSDGDEYIHSGEDSKKSTGAYRIENDKNGHKRFVFDRPNSVKKDEPSESAPKTEQAAKSPEDALKPDADANPSEKPEKENGPEKPGDKESGYSIANTDKVDAEIKKLKTEKQQAKQELNRVRDDEEKRREVEQRLAQIEAALSAKDNDAYRKANTTVTSSPAPM